MPSYVPVSRTHHRESGVRVQDYSFALNTPFVPVYAQELPQLLPTMVLAFVRQGASGALTLVALQSLQPDNNVYVHADGRWIGGYRPASYRAHPFRLFPQEGSDRQVLAVDESAPSFHAEAEEGDRRLFTVEGEVAPHLKELMAFLEALENNRQLTQVAVDRLDHYGVIVPWSIETRSAQGETGRSVSGYYHIDEKALRELDGVALADLSKSGGLAVAYAQLMSEHRMGAMTRLYQVRSEYLANRRKLEDVDVEALFADDEDDDLKF